jgi:alpha-ribazole phosphatase
MELYLIRHPRPDIEAGICYGQTDVGVQEKDLEDAVKGLSKLIPQNYELWSSPLTRCRLLAEALHNSPRFDNRLMEINFGDWENKTWDQIGKSAVEQWAANVMDFVPPNGESVVSLQKRVANFLDGLPKDKPTVIVCHGGVMRAIAGLLVKEHAGNWMQLSFNYASLSKIVSQGGLFDLHTIDS